MRPVVGVLAAALLAGGCADGSPSAPGRVAGTIVVSAAASLTDAFTEIAAAFETRHADATVDLNVGSSATLREQVLAGAPVDVLATASQPIMDEVVAAGLAVEPQILARNELVIGVPAGNPATVTSLNDFAHPERFVGLCVRTAPCGGLARDVLARAGVRASVDTIEPDVRALATRLAEGELDMGLVYATDVTASDGELESIALPDDLAVTTAYPIATLVASRNTETADAFVAWVLAPDGQQILRRHGFGAP